MLVPLRRGALRTPTRKRPERPPKLKRLIFFSVVPSFTRAVASASHSSCYLVSRSPFRVSTVCQEQASDEVQFLVKNLKSPFCLPFQNVPPPSSAGTRGIPSIASNISFFPLWCCATIFSMLTSASCPGFSLQFFPPCVEIHAAIAFYYSPSIRRWLFYFDYRIRVTLCPLPPGFLISRPHTLAVVCSLFLSFFGRFSPPHPSKALTVYGAGLGPDAR